MAGSRASVHDRDYRGHDVRALHARWRAAVKGTGFRATVVGKKDGFPLMQVRNRVMNDRPGFYVSAGIHGDEPAPLWALLEWFEQGGHEGLGDRPILLFPCLNPLGIMENHRMDGEGRDLNRLFDQLDLSPIREVRQAVRDSRYRVAVCLHEDYDAHGAYLYDLNKTGDSESGRALLERATTKRVPVDDRTRIDGRPVDRGVIFRRRLDLRNIPGLPEAVYLFLEGHAERTLTFETPSEFSLAERVKTHVRFLKAVARMVQGEGDAS